MQNNPIYYPINETAAKQSMQMWSFFDYVPNSATEEYKSTVDKCYDVARQVIDQKPDKVEEILKLAERYSRYLANWKNTGFQIDMMCPSVMICGPSNYPVRKHEKQMQRMDTHMKEYDRINDIPKQIQDILYGKEIIKSSDDDAIEQLQTKVDNLTAELEQNKEMNKHFRKFGTMKGFARITEEQATQMDFDISSLHFDKVPCPSYHLTNLRQKIKATKDRLARIQRLKTQAETKVKEDQYNSNICKVVENAELMRIQLLFDGKPSENIRNILKSNGFRWSPSEMAWQRQLTDNARYTTKQVLKQLESAS